MTFLDFVPEQLCPLCLKKNGVIRVWFSDGETINFRHFGPGGMNECFGSMHVKPFELKLRKLRSRPHRG